MIQEETSDRLPVGEKDKNAYEAIARTLTLQEGRSLGGEMAH